MVNETPARRQAIYDPRGIVYTELSPVAPRKVTLNGLRLAVLDNTKWNANKLLRGSVQLLDKKYGFAQINYYRKENFSKNAAPELISQIAANNDLVLTAIGD